MGDYEPTPEQVEAFKRAWHEADAEGDTGNRTLRGLTAAGPLIERAVRERIEAEIEAFEPEDRWLVHVPEWREAMEDAARIARGEGS